MSAIRRALEILDCFTEEQTNLTFEQIGQSTGLPKTTLYRNLRALLDFGLISESAPGHYIIGSRVLQLDYLARRCDPLLQVASEQAILLSEEFGSRSLICQDYADHVLCIFAVGGEGYHSAFDRGILRPYLRGAASLAILSTFNSYRVRKLYHQYAQNQSAEEFAALRQRLRLIRKNGYSITHQDLTPNIVGVAVPLIDEKRKLAASLSLSFNAVIFNSTDVKSIIKKLKSVRTKIELKLLG